MKNLIYLLLSSLCTMIYGQSPSPSKLQTIQGIWEFTENNETENSFTITNGKNSLSFTYSNDFTKLDFPLTESIKGFQDEFPTKKDSINVNLLKDDGKYYTVIFKKDVGKNGSVPSRGYLIPDYFETDGEIMSINGGQLVEYQKIQRLPTNALKLLLRRGNVDKRNYIKEYLNIDAKEVKVNKCQIYSDPGILTKMYLIKGDVVNILEKKQDWVYIEYMGSRLIKGWIKDQDVK